jgi:tRNA dimethylallyltransferase
MKLPKIIVIVGPTASGKTELALRLAEKYSGEIVNADSRQVYRWMDIGTAKPNGRWSMDDGRWTYVVNNIPHHLMDIIEPNQDFSLADYKKIAFETIDDIIKRGKLPIIVGGTGLYVWAIVDNPDIPAVVPDLALRQKLAEKTPSELAEMLKTKDPVLAEKTDLKNPRRVIRALEIVLAGGESPVKNQNKLPSRYDALQIGLTVPREELNARINARVDRQITRGLIEEVFGLAKKYSWVLPAMSGIGYKQLGYYLRGEMPLPEAIELIKRDTRRYAKRQMTWFKRDKRIQWIEQAGEAEELVKKLY